MNWICLSVRYAAGRLAIEVTCPCLYSMYTRIVCLPACPATRLLFATACLSACLPVLSSVCLRCLNCNPVSLTGLLSCLPDKHGCQSRYLLCLIRSFFLFILLRLTWAACVQACLPAWLTDGLPAPVCDLSRSACHSVGNLYAFFQYIQPDVMYEFNTTVLADAGVEQDWLPRNLSSYGQVSPHRRYSVFRREFG